MNLENKTFENLSKIDLKKYWDLAKKQV